MADFGIQYAQGTVSGQSGAAPITADVGAPYRAIAGAGRDIYQLGQTIETKRKQMTDSNSAVQAQGIRDLADQEFETYKLSNPQETWVPFREKQLSDVQSHIGKLNFSQDAMVEQSVKSQAYSQKNMASAFTDSTRQLRTDTIDTQTNSVLNSFRSGTEEQQKEAVARYMANGANMGMDNNEVQANIADLKDKGEKLKKSDILLVEKQKISDILIQARQPGLSEDAQAVILDTARDVTMKSQMQPDQINAQLQNIDYLQASLKRRDEKEKYQKELATTISFEQVLSNDEMTLDLAREMYPSTAERGEDRAQVEWWQKTIQGKNKPAPKESDGVGADTTLKILNEYRLGEKDKISAIRGLMGLRYQGVTPDKTNGVISDQTYNLAMKRIVNDYSPHNSSVIDSILSTREAEYKAEENSVLYTPWEKKAVGKRLEDESIRLYAYVDNVLEKDPEHIFEPSELNNMSGQIKATMPRSFGPTAPVYQQRVPQTDINTEPQTYEEFYRNVSVLKSLNYEQAIEYNAKWGNKWSE